MRYKRTSAVRQVFRGMLWGGALLILFLLYFCFCIFSSPFGAFVWSIPQIRSGSVLILLQNEAEVRPSGGFISAVGILNFDTIIPSLTLIDSYSIAEPSERISAPKPIENVFSQDPKYRGWTFRDSNFSPDFPESAQEALRFLQHDSRFTRDNFSAVVAVNLGAIEDMMSIFLPEEAETLFFDMQRATKDIDLHSTEELQNRKNILKEKGIALKKEIGIFGIPKAVTSLENSLNKKDVQLWFADAEAQEKAQKKGWTGEMPNSGFFGGNIANLGAKKSNRYITQKYISDFTIDKTGQMQEQFTMFVHHRNTASLISGEGIHFLRIFRPRGTTLIGAHAGWSQKTFPHYEEFSIAHLILPNSEEKFSLTFHYPYLWKEGKRTFRWYAQSGADDTLEAHFQSEGEKRISLSGCDTNVFRENTASCMSSLENNFSLDVELFPDTSPPILENIFFASPSEITTSFSEESLLDSFTLVCKNNTFYSKKISSHILDSTILLDSPVVLSGEFCRYRILGVRDVFGNRREIEGTLPLREKR